MGSLAHVAAADALFWIVCAVLVAAGSSKVMDPAGTAGALGALGLPGGTVAARGLGAVEVVLGLAGLAVGGTLVAAGVAIAYAFFAVVVAVARRRELPSCGCFGARSAPPSRVHVVVNVASAAVAAVAAALGPLGVADGLAGVPLGTAAVTLGLVALATGLVIVVDTVVAEVVEASAALHEQTEQLAPAASGGPASGGER